MMASSLQSPDQPCGVLPSETKLFTLPYVGYGREWGFQLEREKGGMENPCVSFRRGMEHSLKLCSKLVC